MRVEPDRPSPEQIEIWRKMTPAERLMLADDLRKSVMSLKASAIRTEQPDLPEAAVQDRLRNWVLGVDS